MHDDDDLGTRLAAAGERLTALARQLQAGGPWALAERFDHSPEASWGPRETLAHLEEMLAFWLGEAERVVEAPDGTTAVGRVATDDVRLAIIERDRTLPIRELAARVQVGIDRWRQRWPELSATDRRSVGVHPTQGEVSVADLAFRFAVGHLEEHLDQLAETIDRRATR